MSQPRPATTVLATLGCLLLLATPAAAHPAFDGGEAPVDSLASLTLAMAHGCGDEAADGGEPTTEVSLEVPDWMTVVAVPAPDGWEVTLESDDGDVEVVTWSAPDATEPAPAFDLDVVVTGEVGTRQHVRVLQACDDDVLRWIGTPDDPADDPAVNLTLAEADPSSPPPEDLAAAEQAAIDAHAPEDADPEDGADTADEDGADPDEDGTDTGDGAGDADAPGGDAAADTGEQPADDSADGDGSADEEVDDPAEADDPEELDETIPDPEGAPTGPPAWLILLAVLGFVAGAILFLRRRGAGS